MPGILFYFDKKSEFNTRILIDSINLSGSEVVDIFCNNKIFMASSKIKNASYHSLLIKNEYTVLLIYGQLSRDDLDVISNNSISDINDLSHLDGYFCSIFYNKSRNKVQAISHYYGIEPIYYYTSDDTVLISSELPAFAKNITQLNDKINPKWVYEFLFFNFQISHTPIKDVSRLKGNEILKCSLDNELNCNINNKENYRDSEFINRITPKEFAEHLNHRLTNVLKDVTQRKKTAISITSGWDSKTLLSILKKEGIDFTGYTYGVKDSKEIMFSKYFTKKLNIPLQLINLDDAFIANYLDNAIESVYLSGGLNNTGRSAINFVYSNLIDYDLVITGIAMSQLFKGHSNVPSGISSLVENIFQGKKEMPLLVHQDKLKEAEECVETAIINLENSYGNPKCSLHHLKYLIYQDSGNRFIGEIRLSRNYTNAIVPVWYRDIIQSAFSHKHTALKYSQFKNSYNKFLNQKESRVHSHILTNNSRSIAAIDCRDIKPIYLNHSELLSLLYSISKKAVRRLNYLVKKKSYYSPEEPNAYCLSKYSKEIVSLLKSEDSTIKQYIHKDFFENSIKTNNKHWINKFLTLEITARLINNGWKKFKI